MLHLMESGQMKCWWVGIQSVFGKHSFCNNLKNFDFISFITFYSIILPRIVFFVLFCFFDCMSIFRTVRAPRSALSYFRVLLFPFLCSSSIFCLWPWNQLRLPCWKSARSLKITPEEAAAAGVISQRCIHCFYLRVSKRHCTQLQYTNHDIL